jgi:protein ImuB
MQKRYLSLWFKYLLTDWQSASQSMSTPCPMVFTKQERNRNIVIALNALAEAEGVSLGMTAADAKAIATPLEVIEAVLGKEKKLLKQIGLWCIRYTPIVALDASDGLILDITGCTHLWGSEENYLQVIINQLKGKGYYFKAGIAATIGAAWGIARFAQGTTILASGAHLHALKCLPPAALRLTNETLEKLQKLGFTTIASFMDLPINELRKRFGEMIVLRLKQALGTAEELIVPLVAPVPYLFRLPSLEPIKTVTGIEMAIAELLKMLCARLAGEGKGVRKAILKCYRIDGKIVQVGISTAQASSSMSHLMKLFKLQISKIEPKLGIELFVLQALKTEKQKQEQEQIWQGNPKLNAPDLVALLDRIAVKAEGVRIYRYLPTPYYWPEQSVKVAQTLTETAQSEWLTHRPRPIRMLSKPAPIQVMALLPDYPPRQFLYKNKMHIVLKADGPERIEREWWRDQGPLRDYYVLEDEHGKRYWVFRSGHYNDEITQWFLHGFFA